ncbi:hypothetical protein [Sphingomonas sp. LHG3406-1]|nr:hypothetical protein [Sphingomonas sp. LHG3406-1]
MDKVLDKRKPWSRPVLRPLQFGADELCRLFPDADRTVIEVAAARSSEPR